MELKVWVEGIQRIVCGVTETTTCQDVVYALAHATGKSGRFSLIERWRNNERHLAPNEHPLKIVMKWGEYSNDVQFILQWNDCKNNKNKQVNTIISSPNSTIEDQNKNDKTKPGQISNQFSSPENIGIVRGIPQNKLPLSELKTHYSPSSSPKKSSCSGSDKSDSPSHRIAPPYKDPPAPPPYRNPPPPSVNNQEKFRINHVQNTKTDKDSQDSILFNAQYKELIALINYQREKLSNQQADLTKYDAEIVFWEGKEREKQMQLDYITKELLQMSNMSRLNQEQIQALVHVEEENEIVKQQEKTLMSELTLLRSKLANCETELLQCKNKIRLLMDDYQTEQKMQQKQNDARRQVHKGLLVEMERLQKDVELAKQSTELHHITAETLKKEVAALEEAIVQKKREVEKLVDEMKEANLESLTAAPSEDVRQTIEGPAKHGSTRKMIGSPRQLENAVPTNKNPHGVWV